MKICVFPQDFEENIDFFSIWFLERGTFEYYFLLDHVLLTKEYEQKITFTSSNNIFLLS